MRSNPSLLPDVARFFDDYFTRDLFNWSNNHFSTTNTTIPAVNIRETNDEYIVEMAAPGMSKKDFHIEVNNNMLTIRSEHKQENTDSSDDRWLLREFSYQSFERTFQLNKEVVDDAHIKASYKNGLLLLHIPKKEEAKVQPPKLITVA
ncbi:MAG: Hsp20/alpha crystallin family protein [Bacteroidetes bacterium]|nr:MAG: Hsp20/alpha crystallin family protein [Bacteroidota bacterium]